MLIITYEELREGKYCSQNGKIKNQGSTDQPFYKRSSHLCDEWQTGLISLLFLGNHQQSSEVFFSEQSCYKTNSQSEEIHEQKEEKIENKNIKRLDYLDMHNNIFMKRPSYNSSIINCFFVSWNPLCLVQFKLQNKSLICLTMKITPIFNLVKFYSK